MADTHIKIKPVTPRVQYTANGSTTVFPYSFAIFDETDMVVYVDDEIITTGYTVSGAGQTDGGNVTFGTAPEDGKKITLLRNVPIERMTDFQEGGTFRPKNLNDEFDRQTAFVQQVQEILDRSVKVGPTSEITPETVLAEVERVYGSIDNIDTVADDITNVNTVASNISKVQTTANNISSVNTVAGNISNVNTVAGISSNVTAVAGNTTNINAVAGNATNINAVNANKTNIDTVAGNSSNINTVATNISNVNNCATNMAAILDAPNQAASAAASAELSAQYANDKINQTHISNCITEIPQDIKLELNSGTLTLKAGSKVYVPNGIGVFDAVTVANDTTINCSTATGQTMVFYRTDGAAFGDNLVSNCNSGTTPTYGFFYSTSVNKIDFYTGSEFQGNTFSFPLAIITVSSGTVTSIDQVFNGFGFIGNTIFGLPGVKGLWPDGRNADGTLKNIVKTIDSVTTHTWGAGLWGSNFPVVLGQWGVDFLINTATFIGGKRPENPVAYTRWYNNEENYWEDYVSSWNKTYFYIWGYVDLSDGKVVSLRKNTSFHAMDWNDAVKYSDKEQVVYWGMPNYTAAVSKTKATNYTAESNGFLIGYDNLASSGGSTDNIVYIDGINVRVSDGQDNFGTNTWCYPIAKGSSYSYSGSANMSMYFVPAIGG